MALEHGMKHNKGKPKTLNKDKDSSSTDSSTSGQSSKNGILSLPIEVGDRLQKLQYTYADVLEMTKNLNIKLGEGGFGPVYFGKLKDGSPIAVKKLSSSSAQGTHEFLNEVEILSRAHHKNLVSLFGYCCEMNERCLIYELMPKGTLDERLRGPLSEQEPLNWPTRLKSAVGAAKGFNYLHNDCVPAIIHRDVKSSNILLDDNLTAKVADFGLSKLLSQSGLTHITTVVKGTFGYLDPEYAQTNRLTEKSDVYSFGVIILELLTGNKAITQHDGEYVHITQWAQPHIIKKMASNILDKKLGENIDKDAVQTIANIAMRCVASKGIERPTSQEVLQVLEAVLKEEMKLMLPQQVQSLGAMGIDKDAVQTIANIAMRCVASKGIERPTSQVVLQVLEAVLTEEMKLMLPQEVQSLRATGIDKDAVQTISNIAMRCVASKGIERPTLQGALQVLEAVL